MRSQHQPITKNLVAQHGLTEAEHKKVVEILGREPNLAKPESELEG